MSYLLFTYGTLKPKEAMEYIAGRDGHPWHGDSLTATLLNYRLYRAGQLYCVTPMPTFNVEGIVHTHVMDEHLRPLDQYEGNPVLYQRVEAKARLADGKTVDVLVYEGNEILDRAYPVDEMEYAYD